MSAHFKFALFILEILAEVNTIYQAKYGFLPFFFEYVGAMDTFFRDELRKIVNGDFSRFPFLHN